jgi:hypothetical protein
MYRSGCPPSSPCQWPAAAPLRVPRRARGPQRPPFEPSLSRLLAVTSAQECRNAWAWAFRRALQAAGTARTVRRASAPRCMVREVPLVYGLGCNQMARVRMALHRRWDRGAPRWRAPATRAERGALTVLKMRGEDENRLLAREGMRGEATRRGPARTARAGNRAHSAWFVAFSQWRVSVCVYYCRTYYKAVCVGSVCLLLNYCKT